MLIEPGFYIAKFRTPLDESSGVLMIDGDTVRGGDSAMFYVGEISGDPKKIAVKMRVRQHDPDKYSVFGDVTDFMLTLTGRKKGAAYAFEGRADRAPSLRFEATMTPAPK
jgi:hypothetical protein